MSTSEKRKKRLEKTTGLNFTANFDHNSKHPCTFANFLSMAGVSVVVQIAPPKKGAKLRVATN
jgi:hypothetical protein